MILFGPKRPNLRIWSWNFRKQISDLKSAFPKYGTSKIWLRLENWYLLAQDTQIWAYGLKIWKMKAIRKFQISSILKIWIVLGRFIIFWGVVSVRFRSFWLVAGFSKYFLEYGVKRHNILWFLSSSYWYFWMFECNFNFIFWIFLSGKLDSMAASCCGNIIGP